MPTPVPRSHVLAASLFMLAVAGCGGGTGTLTGKVSYKGKPVVYGSVLVRCADGIQRAGNIELDGSYTVLNVPTGPVKIGVDSPEPPSAADISHRGSRPGAKAAAAAPTVDRSKWVKLPDKYADPDQSGQATTVTVGTTPFDITLP